MLDFRRLVAVEGVVIADVADGALGATVTDPPLQAVRRGRARPPSRTLSASTRARIVALRSRAGLIVLAGTAWETLSMPRPRRPSPVFAPTD